jgi:hypothetical protein
VRTRRVFHRMPTRAEAFESFAADLESAAKLISRI